jgi:hypothetical protein
MNTKTLLLELLISGFFAVACFRARAGNAGQVALTPREFLRLTDRLDRLRRTRWQWFAMVLTIVVIRLQSGVPLAIELTAALEFVIFLSLPTQKQQSNNFAVSKVRRKPLSRLAPNK